MRTKEMEKKLGLETIQGCDLGERENSFTFDDVRKLLRTIGDLTGTGANTIREKRETSKRERGAPKDFSCETRGNLIIVQTTA